MQQALDYADILYVPFVFTSNGDSFVFHDKTLTEGEVEKEISLDDFPSPDELWDKYNNFKGLAAEPMRKLVKQDYFVDGSGMSPRYYQQNAVNRTVEAITKEQDRI